MMQMGVHVRVQELLFSVFSQSRRMNQWRSEKGQKPEEAVSKGGRISTVPSGASPEGVRGCSPLELMSAFALERRFARPTL